MARHLLYEINLERMSAFCTVCGHTEIVIPKTRIGKTYKPICANKAKETRERQLEKLELAREERHSQPSWQLHHFLTQIDPVNRTAVCSICGPTDIWKKTNSLTGITHYSCGTHRREQIREYKRAHAQGRPTNPHALSQINDEAGTAICATCGRVKFVIRHSKRYILRRCINAPIPKPRKPRKTK